MKAFDFSIPIFRKGSSKVKLDNKGFSIISLLIGLVIVCLMAILTIKMLNKSTRSATGEQGTKISDPKTKAYGSSCLMTITSLGNTHSAPGSSHDGTDEHSDDNRTSDKTAFTGDASAFTPDGAPVTDDNSDGSFTITGKCLDGNIYTFDSKAGKTTSAPY